MSEGPSEERCATAVGARVISPKHVISLDPGDVPSPVDGGGIFENDDSEQ